MDRQGRIVIPLHERQRLGVTEGGVLDLIPTAEGVSLEPHRTAEVRIAPDGLPVVKIRDLEPVTNEESLEAIHRERDARD